MIIGLFKEIKTTRQTLVNNLAKLFDQYGLKKIYLFMWKMKGQIFKNNDNCLKINYQI
jgi:hypothetical protein